MDEAQTRIQKLEKEVEQLRKENHRLQAMVEMLLAGLKSNSTNSHKPPRTDSPKDKSKRNKGNQKPRSGRSKGGQRGHKGHSRQLVPQDKVDHFIDCFADACTQCGTALSGTDPKPHRHQVVELPPVSPEVTEYRLHRRQCPCCKTTSKGLLPLGVTWSNFGPRLQACCALLTAKYHLSKNDTVEALGDMMGIDLSAASVCANEARVGHALAASSDEALEYLRQCSSLHMDETSWRTSGHLSWLWTVSSGPVALYAVCDERAGIVAKELLGEDFGGIVHTDRYGGYNHLPDEQRQYCWAHLRRDFKAMSLRGGRCGGIGQQLVEATKELFNLTRRIRDGTLARAEFVEKMAPIQKQIRESLLEGSDVPQRPFGTMCKSLVKHDMCLWHFVEREDVEATNNEAERNMRHGVLWRERSGGNDSVKGTIFTERILTVVESMRRQGRHALDFVADTLKAVWSGVQPPSILPAPS